LSNYLEFVATKIISNLSDILNATEQHCFICRC